MVSRGAAAATERSRYGGPDEPLRKIYAKHCKLRGPSFITYNEAETVSSSKLDKEMVRKHHELLSDINALTDKLALKRKQNERCLLEVGKASVDRWKLDSTMLSDWVSCMDKRVRSKGDGWPTQAASSTMGRRASLGQRCHCGVGCDAWPSRTSHPEGRRQEEARTD